MDGRYNLPYRQYNNSSTGYNGRYQEEEVEYQRRRDEQEREPEAQPKEEPQKKETMSSWLSRITGTREAQFAATAVVSGAVVAGAILGYQHVRRQERVEDLKGSIPGWGSESAKVGIS